MSASLQGVQTALQSLHAAALGAQPAAARLDALEGRLAALETSLDKVVAEAEAWYLRAEAKHRLTRNAEQRAHDKLKKVEALAGDEDSLDEREAFVAAMAARDAENGRTEGLPPVHQGVEPLSGKEAARAYKYQSGG